MKTTTQQSLKDGRFYQESGDTLTLAGNLKYKTHPNITGSTQLVDKRFVEDQLGYKIELDNVSSYTITGTSKYILLLVTPPTGGTRIFLPPSPLDGTVVKVKDKNGSAVSSYKINNILIDGNGSTVEDFLRDIVPNAKNGVIELVYSEIDSTWYVITLQRNII